MVRIFLTKNYIYFGINRKGALHYKSEQSKRFESIIKVIVELKISWF